MDGSAVKKLYDKIHLWLKNALFHVKKKQVITAVICVLTLFSMALIGVLSVSLAIKSSTEDNIVPINEAAELENIDLIIVLGAGLRKDGNPSDMLADRLKTGIELVKKGANGKLLLTGDNSGEHYNEVGAMNEFVINEGISPEIILLDNEGFSTYESIYRAKNEFNAKNVIIITQKYHLHRAIYIAESLGLKAYGVSADIREYRGQGYRDAREHLARFKDFWQCLIESGK